MRISRSNRSAGVLLLSGLLLSLAVLGCGDDSDEPVAKAQYVKEADAICGKTEGRQRVLVEKLGKGTAEGKEAQLEFVRQAGIPPLATQLEELEELPDPEAEAEQAEAFLSEFRAALEQVEEDPELMVASAPFAKAEAAAAEFGFQVCGGA